MMDTRTLAIDFGTSNSAAALMQQGALRRILVEHDQPTLPTAVFFPDDEGPMQIGRAAIDALISGQEGRFMRALKSVLGLPLFHERRLISGRRRSLFEITSAFLAEIKTQAETQTGLPLTRALSGRPVHFHTSSPEKDAQAEQDLRACYLAAGFDGVSFLPEPEAAARATARAQDHGHLSLVVDIGGGTSDFSVVRQDGPRPIVLASHGVRLGGTDFDHTLSMTGVMPDLGLGTELRREMGEGRLPVPVAPFVDLATWAKIPFLYTPETRRSVARMLRLSTAPDKLGRFAQVLEMELGHDIAFAVEAGKIAANTRAGAAAIDLSCIETGLSLPVTKAWMARALAEHARTLAEALNTTLAHAGVHAPDIDEVMLVGGSSLMTLVTDTVQECCPRAALAQGEAFTAIVDGLAYAAEDADRAVA